MSRFNNKLLQFLISYTTISKTMLQESLSFSCESEQNPLEGN